MNKAIFLDRDGTINVEKNYLYKIEDFEFLPGVVEGLKLLQEAGYLLIIITNQSGIARGFYTEDDFLILNSWMLGVLKKSDVNITAVYYCPHLPDAHIEKYRKDCECRKPKLGLFNDAINEYDIDINNSFAIGDKVRDLEICFHSSCRGFLIGNNEKKDIVADLNYRGGGNIIHVNTITDCVRLILEQQKETVALK